MTDYIGEGKIVEHSTGNIEKAHKAEGQRRIGELKRKIGTTKDNIEVSEEIIANSASDAQREKLIEKNTQRRHAVGSMKKEIRDIEQTIEERGREVST
jgi:predicted  nucleic acid-binding Zn-ribbon protein